MPCNISKVEYYKTTTQNRPGEAYKFLSQLALLKINLLAFTATPVSTTETELTVFPDQEQAFFWKAPILLCLSSAMTGLEPWLISI